MDITIENESVILNVKEVCMKKDYELNDDYVLEVLEGAESKTFEELLGSMDEDNQFKLDKLCAIKEAIRKIELEKAFIKGKASNLRIK